MPIIALITGLFIITLTFLSAMRTFVVPRSTRVMLTNIPFMLVRKLFDAIGRLLPNYGLQDGLMAMYAPFTLLMLVPFWLFLTTFGYALMFWGLGVEPFADAYILSGSSILTLGLASAETFPQTILVFTEATIGLILVAMLISYLPTMYSAFSTREAAVAKLEARAGIPVTAPELVWRLHMLGNASSPNTFWEDWEEWFTAIDESHTSLAALVFFRSTQKHQSWVNAAGAVLDAAALEHSTILHETAVPHPTLTIRAGVVALRHIADFFQVKYNADPHFPADPISVSRADFEKAYLRLKAQGLTLHDDMEDAWINFAGWRVNYDSVLNALAKLTMAPETEWIAETSMMPVISESGRISSRLGKPEEELPPL